MKNVIASVLTVTFILGLASSVRAEGLTYVQKQQISCKAIADSVMEAAVKAGEVKMKDALQIHTGARVLCLQSYNQASADYSIKKAKASASEKAGTIGAMVVELSYDAYKADTK